ncbi:dTDP-4-dehydrorhamnose 3,5-epimerase family protein [Agrobacterium vacciniicorymbosi]
MPRFTFTPLSLSDLMLVERQRIGDDRGFFSRFFCVEEIPKFGTGRISQINHTMTQAKGVIRGMHFQHAPYDETKLVSCIKGVIFDVAVDLRPYSPTYLKWHGEILSEENLRSLLIPAGFAHGFQTLSANCELVYLHDKQHTPEAEGGVNPFDPKLNISWPLPLTQMSIRDSNFTLL